jgi:hypothetical protein
MTALDTNSKGDTVFLALPAGAGSAALAVDVSQHRTDLTDNTDYCFEQPSVRTALIYPREISLVLDLSNTTSGTLLKHGEEGINSNHTYKIAVNAGSLTFLENGNTRASAALPGVGGSDETFLVHWSTRAEGTSVRTEVYVRNLDDNSEVHVQETHAAGTTDLDWTLWVNGDDFDPGPATLTRWASVRISQRFHSTTEAREDWVAQTTPPAITARRRAPVLTFETSDLDVAQDDYPAGPTYAWALHQARESDMRMLGPLVNLRPRAPYAERNTYAPENFFRRAPDVAPPAVPLYHLCLRYLWHVRVPPKCNRVRARIHVQVYTVGADTCVMRFRMFSMQPAGAPLIPLTPFGWFGGPATSLTADHGPTGVGEWVDLGEIKIAEKPNAPHEGWTVFALGFSFNFDSGDPEEDDTLIKIKAVVIEPVFVEGGDGLDLGFAEEGG